MNEQTTHSQICQYLKAQYKSAIFNTDLSGIRLPMGLAVKASKLRWSSGFPDIVIYEPRGGFYGLFIEVKKDGVKLIKKNGEWISPHVEKQYDMMAQLRERGFKAMFARGFNDAKIIIDEYMNQWKSNSRNAKDLIKLSADIVKEKIQQLHF